MTLSIGTRSPRPKRWHWPTGTSSVTTEAMPFLDPIDRICEEAAPRLLRVTHALIALLFLSLLLVAALVRVDVVVTGSGRLTTDTASIVLQPMERSILHEMNVKPGDVVTKGQVLANLDPTFARADQTASVAQAHTLAATLRRLEAESTGQPLMLPDRPDPDDMLQMSLYRQRQAEYASRARVFDEDIARLAANVRTTGDDRAALTRQVEISRAVETMRATLMAHQTGSKLQYLDALAQRLRAEREWLNAGDRLAELRHGLLSKTAERQGFIDAWRRELSETLVSTRSDVAKADEAVAKSSRLNELVVLTAPQDGVVLDVAQRSGGSVLREAEPLITITPSHAALIAEVLIGSRDVGYVLPGAPAEIKVDAFPYQRHGVLKGSMLSIAEESFTSQGGMDAMHRVRIELASTMLPSMPPNVRLFAGMTLSAEIKIGSRSALSYFLTPVTRGLQESLREP